MAQAGFGGFSAREVARRIGYSVGTIYNVFDSLDHLNRVLGLVMEHYNDVARTLIERPNRRNYLAVRISRLTASRNTTLRYSGECERSTKIILRLIVDRDAADADAELDGVLCGLSE